LGRIASALASVRSFMFGGGGANDWATVGGVDYIPARRAASGGGAVVATADSSLRHSAVFACLRLRANLVSATPLDVYRMAGGVQVEVLPKPDLLVSPGGARRAYLAGGANTLMGEWLWSTQFDLDRFGNAFGVITQFDGLGYPDIVELVPTADVRLFGRGSRIDEVRVNGERFDPSQIWHERQYTVPGAPVGLSPLAYAGWSISGYLSAQKFGLDYFAAGGMPSGVLRNTEVDDIGNGIIDKAKAQFKLAVEGRDVFVVGRSWEWHPEAQESAAAAFLDEMKYGVGDVARFLDVPGDMIDAENASGSITYANITQRNLQLLITSLGPAFKRREDTFTSATRPGQFVKFNTDALLRMDPATRQATILARVAAGTLTRTEARALDDLPPLTAAQVEEFHALTVVRQQTPAEALQKAYLAVGKVVTSDEARAIANTAGANLPIPGPDFGSPEPAPIPTGAPGE
jgi:phage portal protein BeeE